MKMIPLYKTISAVTFSCGLLCATSFGAEKKKDAGGGQSYFLTQHVSITTDAGVMGFPPGTEVKKVGTIPNGLKVKSADGSLFNVPSLQLTTEKADAAARAQQDAAQQAEIRSQSAAQARDSEELKKSDAQAQLVRQREAQATLPNGGSLAPSVNLTGTTMTSESSLSQGPKDAGVTVRHPKPVARNNNNNNKRRR